MATKRFPYLHVLTIAAGHLVQDTFAAFYPVLLPRLAQVLGISRGVAGLLEFVRLAPSVLNPLLGYWADRYAATWFVALAPGLTATAMTLLGRSRGLPELLFLLLLTGVGIAMFHASAPAWVARSSGPYAGRGMSFFMAAGELARTIGPPLAVAAVLRLGMQGLPWLAPVGWTASLMLWLRLVRNHKPQVHPQVLPFWEAATLWMRRFGWLLALLIVGRTMLTGVLNTYLAWYLMDSGLSWATAGRMVALYEGTGVLAALAAGAWSDRFGRRRVAALGMTVGAGALLALTWLPTAWKPWLLPLLGAGVLSVQPVFLALVQDTVQVHRAMANGLYMGMSFLLRPLSVAAIGAAADLWGWAWALRMAAGLALLSLPLLLPRSLWQALDEGG